MQHVQRATPRQNPDTHTACGTAQQHKRRNNSVRESPHSICGGAGGTTGGDSRSHSTSDVKHCHKQCSRERTHATCAGIRCSMHHREQQQQVAHHNNMKYHQKRCSEREPTQRAWGCKTHHRMQQQVAHHNKKHLHSSVLEEDTQTACMGVQQAPGEVTTTGCTKTLESMRVQQQKNYIVGCRMHTTIQNTVNRHEGIHGQRAIRVAEHGNNNR